MLPVSRTYARSAIESAFFAFCSTRRTVVPSLETSPIILKISFTKRGERPIEGSSISDKFKKIFACQYYFDENGNAIWPKVAINYTQKTQYVFRISKGVYDETENKRVNDKMRERLIPYQNMIYFGDGITDIPCMTLIKKQGGVSIAVYPKGNKAKVTDLLLDDRVNYICPADYQEGGDLDSLVKCIIQKMKLSHTLLLKYNQQRHRESKKNKG